MTHALTCYEDYINNQTKQIELKTRDDMTRAPSYGESLAFALIRKKISLFALKEFHSQVKRTRDTTLPACTDVFTRVMGIPCAHTILHKARSNEPITTKDFDDQWLLDPLTIQAEAHAVPPILVSIDGLFEEITELSKAEQPFAFERLQNKLVATSGALLPPREENTQKKGRPKKADTKRIMSGHEREEARLAHLREVRDEEEKLRILQEKKEQEKELCALREKKKQAEEQLAQLMEANDVEANDEERLVRRKRTVDPEAGSRMRGVHVKRFRAVDA